LLMSWRSRERGEKHCARSPVNCDNTFPLNAEFPGVILSLSSRVENMHKIRQTGREAELGEDLTLTTDIRTSDARGRVFALVAIPKFAKVCVEADCSKATNQIACETAALLIQTELPSHIRMRSWEHKHSNTPFMARKVVDYITGELEQHVTGILELRLSS
jgi:hypothetical protein